MLASLWCSAILLAVASILAIIALVNFGHSLGQSKILLAVASIYFERCGNVAAILELDEHLQVSKITDENLIPIPTTDN